MDLGFLARRIVIAARIGQAQQRLRRQRKAAAQRTAEDAAQRERGRELAAQIRDARRPPRDAVSDADMLERAAQLVIERQDGSTTMLARELRVGVLTAVRLMSELESRGVVGPQHGTDPREVLVPRAAD